MSGKVKDSFVFSVGVGVFIRNPTDDTILLMKRGAGCPRGVGCWALPGGVVEAGETIAQAVLREVKEETDLDVQLYGGFPLPSRVGAPSSPTPFCVPGLLAVTDHSDIHQQMDGKLLPHLSLWVMTAYAGGKPKRMEPHKCVELRWMKPAEIASMVPWAGNPTHEQYFWTPLPLWRRILRPYFGDF